jgi:hypothetical protein
LSQYIAYDTLTPPNPFIAVTQDGTGNVVYDGGFPKFYNTYAPEAGIDSLFSMEYKGTRDAGATGNTYYYDAFTDVQVTIAPGDKLVYDMLTNSIDARVGIDAITAANPAIDATHYSIRDWGGAGPGVMKDQNGLAAHPASDLGTLAVGQWYHRVIDLSPAAGYTFIKWSLAYEGEIPGVFYTRFKEVYILDSAGSIKAVLFKDKIKLPNSTSTEAGASGYSGTSKYIYDPRSRLTGSFKYLFNCLRFIANPAKVAAGNKKILFIGDQAGEGINYSIKNTDMYGFAVSINRICAAAGFIPTIKDHTDYGGTIATNLAELNQYCAVVVFSTAYDISNVARITPGSVTDFATYRAQGNGIALITDHGSNVQTDIAQVTGPLGAGFYGTANRIAVQFGAFFTGNYDRFPVNVGFLRSTYGDHPLYDGLDNDESIIAGGSESKVIVTTATLIAPGAMPNTTVGTGANKIYFLLKMADGSIQTYTFVYNVATGEIIEFKDAQGNNLTSVDVGWNFRAKPVVKLIGAGLGSLAGSIYRNGIKVGEVSYDETNGSNELWYSGEAVRVNHGDTIRAAIESPFTYSRTLNVNRIQPDINDLNALANVVGLIAPSAPGTYRVRAVEKAMAEVGAFYPMVYSPAHAKNIYQLRNYMEGNIALSDVNAFAYDTNAGVIDALARLVPPTPKQIFDNWSRFNADAWFPKGTTPTADAAAWYWDDVLGSAVQPNNTGGWTGFISDYSVLDYDLEVTLKSTNGDDDFIGVVLGFVRDDVAGQNHTLDLVLTRGARNYENRPIWPSQVLCTDFQYKNTWVAQNGRYKELSVVQGPDVGGWSGAFKRVKILRRGDQFTIQATAWSGATYDPAYNMSFNLNDIPELAKFKGPSPIGFGAMSQPLATFNNIVFADGYRRDIILDVLNNRVYRYMNGAWALAPGVTIHQAFGYPRVINAIEGFKRYRLNADGTTISVI